MSYLGLYVAFFTAVFLGASAGFSWTVKQTRKAVESLNASARTLGLSSQRLVGEASLLRIAALRRDVGLSGEPARGPNYEFLEGEE